MTSDLQSSQLTNPQYQSDEIVASVVQWLEEFVVKLNICPFAGGVLKEDKIRFAVSISTTEEAVLEELVAEFNRLDADAEIETSLFITPNLFSEFSDYNQFLNAVDALLVGLNLDGVYQIASFHPNYQFAGTEQDDVENYTNRAPYPIFHILREASVAYAIAAYPDTHDIPTRNIALMKQMGAAAISQLLRKSS